MNNKKFDKYGEKLTYLGFGCMILPLLANEWETKEPHKKNSKKKIPIKRKKLKKKKPFTKFIKVFKIRVKRVLSR